MNGGGPQLGQYRSSFPPVRFLDYRNRNDRAKHFAAADVFVLASRFETFGLVVLEALACGKPVTALPVPRPPDIVGSGRTSRFCRKTCGMRP